MARALSMYKTKISTFHGYTSVTYHRTEIVKFDAELILLNFGGYDTVTTRRKMNQVSKMYDLGYTVYRTKGITWVRYNNKDYDYADRIVIKRENEDWINQVA